MKELSEDTNLQISVKTLVGIAIAIASAVGMYYALMQEIEIAKEMPKPNITRTEFDLKDQMIRDAVMNTQKQVEEISHDVKVIDERLFEIQQNQKWEPYYLRFYYPRVSTARRRLWCILMRSLMNQTIGTV